MGVGYLNTTMYEEIRKVIIAVAWIRCEAFWLISASAVATKAIKSENSLICPRRNPISQPNGIVSLNPESS